MVNKRLLFGPLVAVILLLPIMFLNSIVTEIELAIKPSNLLDFPKYAKIPISKRRKSIKYPPLSEKVARGYCSTVGILRSGRASGSGAVIRRKKGEKLKVLTAWHVVANRVGEDIKVLHTDRTVSIVRVVRSRPKNDLALLVGTQKEKQSGCFSTPAKHPPMIGDDLFVVGSPSGLLGNVSKGILSNIVYDSKFIGLYYRTDAAIYPGNSGGGVYNQKGELVGIANAVETARLSPLDPSIHIVPGGGIVIPLNIIKSFL